MNKTLTVKPQLAVVATVVVLAVGAVVGAVVGRSTSQAGTAPGVTRSDPSAAGVGALTGGWRMTSLEVGNRGSLQQIPYNGEIVFTADGRVAVQARNPDTTAQDTQYTVGGYEAWAGQVTINPGGTTFTARVDSAVAPAMVGTEQERRYEVADDTLVLTPADDSGAFRATYARY